MFILAWFLLVHLIKACFFIQALCIAFAPFAALICNYIAWRRNLPIVRYALLGVLGAACFIMPWIYPDSTNAKQANLSWNRQCRIHNPIRALVLRSAWKPSACDLFG